MMGPRNSITGVPMPYNTRLEEKIDSAVKYLKDVDKKKMFGGA